MVFLLNIFRVLNPDKVWFDETTAALSQHNGSNPLLNGPVLAAGIQAAVALFLLYLYWGRRFGRPVPLPDGDRGASVQYISSMANIFRQGRARNIALGNIYEGFWRRLTAGLGVPAGIGTEEIIRLYRQRSSIDSKRLEHILQTASRLAGKDDIPEAELFSLVQDMETWRRENLKYAGY